MFTDMLRQSENFNINYAARIDRIAEIHKIPNADSIVKAVIGTDTVVVGNDMKVGDIVVFFPAGSCICKKYLRTNNLYQNPMLNSNSDAYIQNWNQISELKVRMKHMKGFFDNKGRVRIIKLRGQESTGFVAPVKTLEDTFPELSKCIWSRHLGEFVDQIGNERLCWKYIPPMKAVEPERPEIYKMPWYKRSLRRLKKFNRLIPGIFRPHYDTALLERNAHYIDHEDVITITTKVHGTSIILSNIPVRRKLNWFEKILKALHCYVQETEYGEIYSTRRVIQNKYINPFARKAQVEPNNEYKAVYDEFIGYLDHGMTVYGEIVGYKPNGKCIQSPKGIDHDYGCKPSEHKFMPYRITELDENNEPVEWSVQQVREWVDTVRQMMPDEDKPKLMNMELLYEGLAGDMYDHLWDRICKENSYDNYVAELKAYKESDEFAGFIPIELDCYRNYIENKWRIAWIDAMKNDKSLLKMECPEPLCNNKRAPREGVVVRITGDKLARAWKLKSAKHRELLQKAQDSGEIDQEDIA